MTDAEPTLTFEPVEHRYFLGGRELPSVSRLIAGLYPDFSYVNEEVRQAAADRGTRVHALTEECDAGSLDWFGLDDEEAAYVQAWQSFKGHTGLEIIASEQMVWSAKRGYAGTLDRLVSMHGEIAVIDIKTGEPHDAHGVQLAAYDQAALERGLISNTKFSERFAIYLRADGTYRLERYSRLDDWPCFLACLAVHNWKLGRNE